jgi:AraC family transcriptional regulator
MSDELISPSRIARTEAEFDELLPPLGGAAQTGRAALPQIPGGAARLAAQVYAECLPAIATLIGGAVATFDSDRNASRRYLMRASAILQACAAYEPADEHQPHPKGGLARWQLNRIVDYIERHLSERITGEDLAGQIDVSIGQLFRAFKASVGMPPLRYVVSRRLELVCLLLRTTCEPLSQIAVTGGFCDQSHLCRVFRRVLGTTPVAWRRANAIAPGTGGGERSLVIAARSPSAVNARLTC